MDKEKREERRGKRWRGERPVRPNALAFLSQEKERKRQKKKNERDKKKSGRTGGVLAKNLGQHKRRDEPRRTYSEHGLVGKGVHLNLCVRVRVCVVSHSNISASRRRNRSKAYLPQDDHHKEVEGNAEEVHDRGACAFLHVCRVQRRERGERHTSPSVLGGGFGRGEGKRTGMCVPLSVPKQGK